MANETQKTTNPLQTLVSEVKEDLEKYLREYKEINMLVEQSQGEVAKLAQKNASVTSQLQRVQGRIDNAPKDEIRAAYDMALDAQQRLFVMRGQLEKLNSDQSRLKSMIASLERIQKEIEIGVPESYTQSVTATADIVEMLIQAQETERQRLTRQMHDGPAQALSNFILQTEIASRLFDIDQNRAKEELSSLKLSATSTFQKVRDFIFELRPMMLDDLGLAPTLKRYVDAFQGQQGQDIVLSISGMERRFEQYLEVFIFRSVQELISNAVHNSKATQVKIHVELGEKDIRVVMDDNGAEFDMKSLEEQKLMGIKLIRERTDMLGGFFELESNNHQGTRISFQVPIREHHPLT